MKTLIEAQNDDDGSDGVFFNPKTNVLTIRTGSGVATWNVPIDPKFIRKVGSKIKKTKTKTEIVELAPGKIETFSNRPLKMFGRTIKDGSMISDWFRKYIASRHKAHEKCVGSGGAVGLGGGDIQYKQWYRGQFGKDYTT